MHTWQNVMGLAMLPGRLQLGRDEGAATVAPHKGRQPKDNASNPFPRSCKCCLQGCALLTRVAKKAAPDERGSDLEFARHGS